MQNPLLTSRSSVERASNSLASGAEKMSALELAGPENRCDDPQPSLQALRGALDGDSAPSNTIDCGHNSDAYRKRTIQAALSANEDECGRVLLSDPGTLDVKVSRDLVETAVDIFLELIEQLSIRTISTKISQRGDGWTFVYWNDQPIRLRIAELVREELSAPTIMNKIFNFFMQKTPISQVCVGVLNVEVHTRDGLLCSYPIGNDLHSELIDQLVQTIKFAASLQARTIHRSLPAPGGQRTQARRPYARTASYKRQPDLLDEPDSVRKVILNAIEALQQLATALEDITERQLKARPEPRSVRGDDRYRRRTQ